MPSIGLIAAGDVVYNGPRALFDAMIELYPDRANPGSLWRGANAAKSGAGNGSPGPVTRPAPDEQP